MGSTSYHILFVGDVQLDVFFGEKAATRPTENEIRFSRVSAYAEAIQLIRNGHWDAVLVKDGFDGHSGLELVHHARLLGSHSPIILLNDFYDPSLEYKARKIGATDLVAMDMLDIAYLMSLFEPRERAPQSRRGNNNRFQKKLVSA